MTVLSRSYRHRQGQFREMEENLITDVEFWIAVLFNIQIQFIFLFVR